MSVPGRPAEFAHPGSEPDPPNSSAASHASAEPRRVRPLVSRGDSAEAKEPRPANIIRLRPAIPSDARQWSRAIDRRVKLWQGNRESKMPMVPAVHLTAVSRASFCLDGIDISPRNAQAAVDNDSGGRTLGSRHAQRMRGHVAILRRIERLGRRQVALLPGEVFRWHAALACGLPTAVPDAALNTRLTDVCFRLATPHRRMVPAIEEAARLYADLLIDPLFPNFNGILARLLLAYALARSGLPPVVFDAERDTDVEMATPRRLQELIAAALDDLISMSET